MKVRKAAARDADLVAQLMRIAFAEFERLYLPAAYDATTPSTKRIRERLAEGPMWVALADGRIVGTVAATPRENGLYIRGMAVSPRARGGGIARALMAEVERFAMQEGASRMYLSTTPFLYSAIRLYESIGFRRTGEPPHDLFGTPLFTMAKDLRR